VVTIEPVTSQEHGEERDDVPVGLEGFVEAKQFGLPCGVLHRNDAGAILADNVLGISKTPGENKASHHENHEGNIGAIIDLTGGAVHVLTKWNLNKGLLISSHAQT
jgi:hypothetical protein